MRIEELYVLNPWWREPKSIYTDRLIVAFQNSVFKHYPEKLFLSIQKNKPGIYTIRGPRQIGKTTFLKMFIKNLLESGIKPTNLIFLTCDGIKDRFEFSDMLTIYLQTYGSKLNQLNYILIDEVTVIKDWQLTIKYLADLGMFDTSVVILTGSSAYDLKHSSEKMPGRKGRGKDLVYMPITFNEYLKNIGISVERLSLADILSLSEDEINKLRLEYGFIKEHFFRYLSTGGFPRVIGEFLEKGTVQESINIYKDFVLGDAEKYIGSRTKVLEILRKLPEIVGQRFSWNSLVDIFSGSIGSVDTIQKYMEYLAYSFITFNVFFIDPSTRCIKPKKEKKVYPIDKIIADVITELSGETLGLPQLIELMVLRHILRDEDVSSGLNLYEGPYFWYSERGNEIDFVCERDGKLIPIEVKYQKNISKSDYLGMKKVFGKGVIVTQETSFKDEGIIGIPAWLFFGLVG